MINFSEDSLDLSVTHRPGQTHTADLNLHAADELLPKPILLIAFGAVAFDLLGKGAAGIIETSRPA